MSERAAQVAGDAARAAPGVVVTVATYIGGLSLNDWVAVATLGYLLIMGAHRLYHWRHPGGKAPAEPERNEEDGA